MKSEAGYLISQIHQLSGRIFSKKLREYNIDINHAQGRIIFALWKKDQISIQELAKETSLSKSALTTMLIRMEKSGHLVRRPSEDDKRITLICLTGKSSSMRDDYRKISEEMTEIFYKGFKMNEIKEFEFNLKKVLNNLR